MDNFMRRVRIRCMWYRLKKNDGCIPKIELTSIPEIIYPWSSYNSNIIGWMNCASGHEFTTEYYEATKSLVFRDIVSQNIQDIEFIAWEDTMIPFGIKIVFANDYILSTPTADGNTIETMRFNKNNNLAVFEAKSKINYVSMLNR